MIQTVVVLPAYPHFICNRRCVGDGLVPVGVDDLYTDSSSV